MLAEPVGRPAPSEGPTKHRSKSWFLVAPLLLALLALLPGAALAANWQYAALGDSLAVGLWGFPGYVYRYETYIEKDTRNQVTVTNLGQSGWTSGQLRNALETNATFQNAVRQSTVVTFNIGGNDFLEARAQYKDRACRGTDNQECLRSAAQTFKDNWGAIIGKILSLRDITKTIIRATNAYNPYVDEDKAADSWPGDAGTDFQVFKPYVDDLNRYMCETAASKGIPCADVYRKFNGSNGDVDPATLGYLSFDGLHPNSKGHKAIADLLRALGYSPLKR